LITRSGQKITLEMPKVTPEVGKTKGYVPTKLILPNADKEFKILY